MRHFLQMPRGGRGSFHTFEAVDYTTGAKKERRDVSQALRDVSKGKGGGKGWKRFLLRRGPLMAGFRGKLGTS